MFFKDDYGLCGHRSSVITDFLPCLDFDFSSSTEGSDGGSKSSKRSKKAKKEGKGSRRLSQRLANVIKKPKFSLCDADSVKQKSDGSEA